ncbi:glycosyl hydrolase [Clostridia bacterium]|nr:glycosyl hydrolase [Clostridia bacterium]
MMSTYLNRACERITKRRDNGMEHWQWGQGVALFGLTEVGGSENLDYVRNWLDSHLAAGSPGKSINTAAPLLAAVRLWEDTGDARYSAICGEFARWCLAEAPRSDKGAFEHSCTENVYPNQIWADTLYMGCLFLARYGLLTGEEMYLNEAMRQFALHYEFLSDGETGLIYHGYYGDERRRKGVLWGRGNGWFSAASALILAWVPSSHPLYASVREGFARHTKGLLRFQRADGGWNTVIDDPSSYAEMSGTAAFAFGLAGAGEETAVAAALALLERNTAADGTLLNASGGTCVMDTAAAYNAIGCCYSPFAQGLAMLGLSLRRDSHLALNL